MGSHLDPIGRRIDTRLDTKKTAQAALAIIAEVITITITMVMIMVIFAVAPSLIEL